jgi:uncharacterized membrane protein YeaQ/YmgE (transglycosylase-associated protein family)
VGIIAWIIFGFIVGLIARAIVPGRQALGFIMTTVLGVAGSVVGGLVVSALAGGNVSGFTPAGLIGSIIGAVILLFIGGMVAAPRRRTV